HHAHSLNIHVRASHENVRVYHLNLPCREMSVHKTLAAAKSCASWHRPKIHHEIGQIRAPRQASHEACRSIRPSVSTNCPSRARWLEVIMLRQKTLSWIRM